MIGTVFWTSVSLVTYTYLLYPVLLWLATFWKKAPSYRDPESWPSLSLLVAAYNERAVIADKLENSLQLDYPADKFEIIVVSDCSDDGTDDIVATFAGRGVQLLRLQERGGKTVGQNAAAQLASGEVLVFSDANSIYQADALKQLVRPLDQAAIGCVCGELHYSNPVGAGAGKGEGFYWRYEQFLKRCESRLCSLVGANGSIYAVRRELFEPLAADIISDFIMPIRVWRRRFRVVYEPEARALEHSAEDFSDEFRRRHRIIARSLYGLWTERGVLNPFSNGLFAFQVFSHKVLRWLVPVFLIAALISSGLLALEQPLYRLLFGTQVGFYLLAGLGSIAPRSLGRWGVFYVPAYFCAINLGALLGLGRFLSGRRYRVWQPVSRS